MPNKKAREVHARIMATGKPEFVEGMLQAYYETWEAAETYPKGSEQRLALMAQLVSIFKDGAPYFYAKLANIVHTGADGGAIEHTVTVDGEKKAKALVQRIQRRMPSPVTLSRTARR